jgi:DNA-binding CsgD family transcriptional regulator
MASEPSINTADTGPPTHRGSAVPAVEAFLLYRPRSHRRGDQVSYNPETHQILALKDLPPSKGMDPPQLMPLCLRWQQLLDRQLPQQIASTMASCFLEVYQSWRRRYVVRGCILSDDHASPTRLSADESCLYLFILERASSAKSRLDALCRNWQLSHRERDIVRLLVEDKSNKEIATALHLSVYTVKAYLKLLMRKLGVASRAGVIALLLSGTPPLP